MTAKSSKKTRRFVRRKRYVPKVGELYERASALGITVKEYVEYLNYMNQTPEQRARRRNPASTYDWGPLPFRDEKGHKIRDEQYEQEKRARRKAAAKAERRSKKGRRKSRSRSTGRNSR